MPFLWWYTFDERIIVFYHLNSSFFLPQLKHNKLLQVHSPPQWIFKAKGTHHSKKMSYKPGGTWVQNKYFLFLKTPGLIIEEPMWRILVSTKEHVYFLGEEGNQYRVKKRGKVITKETFWDSNSQNFGFHTNSIHLVFSAQFSYFLSIFPPFKQIMAGMLWSNNTWQHRIDNL